MLFNGTTFANTRDIILGPGFEGLIMSVENHIREKTLVGNLVNKMLADYNYNLKIDGKSILYLPQQAEKYKSQLKLMHPHLAINTSNICDLENPILATIDSLAVMTLGNYKQEHAVHMCLTYPHYATLYGRHYINMC